MQHSLAQSLPTFTCGTPEPEHGNNSSSGDQPEVPNGGNPTFCTSPAVTKYLRVNFHFFLNNDGTGNFNEMDDGLGNTANHGYAIAEQLIDMANFFWDDNRPMRLPNPNSTPNLSPRIQLVLTGTYFHRDTYMANDGPGFYGNASWN